MVTFLPSERPRFIFIHWERWPLTGPRYRFSDSLLLTRLIPATEAKSRFGELLESAPKEPVEISKKGRTVAVVLSVETFQELKEKAEEKSEAPEIDGILNWIERPPLSEQADGRTGLLRSPRRKIRMKIASSSNNC